MLHTYLFTRLKPSKAKNCLGQKTSPKYILFFFWHRFSNRLSYCCGRVVGRAADLCLVAEPQLAPAGWCTSPLLPTHSDMLTQPHMSAGLREWGPDCTYGFHPRLMLRWPNAPISSCSISTIYIVQNAFRSKIFCSVHWVSVTHIPYCSGLLEMTEKQANLFPSWHLFPKLW